MLAEDNQIKSKAQNSIIQSISQKDWLIALIAWLFVSFCVFFWMALTGLDFEDSLITKAGMGVFLTIIEPFWLPFDLLAGKYELWPFILVHPIIDIPVFVYLSSRLRNRKTKTPA